MREKINRFGYLLLKPMIGLVVSGSTRVRAVMIFDDEILLVRSWLGSQDWSLPGGGVQKSEKPKKALRRELREELNLNIQQKQFKKIKKFKQTEHSSNYTAIVYRVNLQSRQSFKIDKSEIIEASWHKTNDLPDNLHPLVDMSLKLLKN